MFVDTFTVQYIRKLRKGDSPDDEPQRITPAISIFAGIVLLICSGVLIAAKSGAVTTPHIQIPKVKLPQLPKFKIPKIPKPKFPQFPKIKFNAQQGQSSKPRNPIIAGEYSVKKLYAVKGVACQDGAHIELWQDGAPDGSTVFGSDHTGGVVGSMTLSEMWQKGDSYFTIAGYNGNQRGIIQINGWTQVVENINPGDGCLFTMQCVNMDGTWIYQQSCANPSKKQYQINQNGCKIAVVDGFSNGRMEQNSLYDGIKDAKIGDVVSNAGVLEFHDTNGCVYKKVAGVASEHE